MDMARSMLKVKNFPNDYWVEFVACTISIINRCPTKNVRNMILEDAWSGRKHIFTHMRVFVCVAYAHVPNELRKKLHNKKEKEITQ